MDEYLTRLKSGALKLYAIEQELPPDEALKVRRAFIEQESRTKLDSVGSYTIPVADAVKKNCENMIGTVQVPLGIAGPLLVNGSFAHGPYYIPLATTEGALVASVNRGCSAITKAGGADVRILRDGMTRAPVFAAASVLHAADAAQWIESHISELQNKASETTRHGVLKSVMTTVVGTNLFARLEFDTKDAMGMNMVTIASQNVADHIARITGVQLIALSGNLCTDKKPAAVNMILGRGRSVTAGVFLPGTLIKEVMKTDVESFIEVNTRKNLVGSARAGSLGQNAHAANIIAALFIACGQDPAHTVEGSLTITTADKRKDGIYVAVTIPALPVGTVGGGTGLATQKECLRLLGVAGGGDPPGVNAKAFAEIVAASVLSGEISLIGAQAAQHLARAHLELGRGEEKITT